VSLTNESLSKLKEQNKSLNVPNQQLKAEATEAHKQRETAEEQANHWQAKSSSLQKMVDTLQ
jgi:FtsZ-binding cell division protein ZapB